MIYPNILKSQKKMKVSITLNLEQKKNYPKDYIEILKKLQIKKQKITIVIIKINLKLISII